MVEVLIDQISLMITVTEFQWLNFRMHMCPEVFWHEFCLKKKFLVTIGTEEIIGIFIAYVNSCQKVTVQIDHFRTRK